jgi:ferredoxin
MDGPAAVLGVDPDADEEEIERAYRDRIMDAHPDQGGSVEEFRSVRMAYERLKRGEDGPQTEPPDDGGESGDDAAGEEGAVGPDHATASTVTYLNYEVLDDHGWSVWDDDLFERAAGADLAEADYGQFYAEPGESLLEAAENRGYAWPFACRGGACVNCAVVLHEGELSMPVNHVLPQEMMERDIRLSCNGMPITDELAVVYNVKHIPALEELLLPPRPFEQAYAGD